MDLDKAIRLRKSVRKFSSKKPDWRDIIECIDSARYSPIAGGNYVCNFILVDEKEKINKIAVATQQDFVAKAKYVVVVCSNPGRLVNAYGKEGEIYSRQQAGAAIENFLLKIVGSGLSTCWVGHFVEDEIKNLLDIPSDSNVEAVFPIGFELKKAIAHTRREALKGKARTKKAPIDLDRILFFNKFGQEEMVKQKKLRD
ncbi:MAG: nitroreductase family protein [Nanoarchaeota archaeon]|nr:nitroreductase family protein [Nanoarchaeota archaeon]